MKYYIYNIGLNKEELTIRHENGQFYYQGWGREGTPVNRKTLRHYLRNCKWFRVSRMKFFRQGFDKTLVAKTYNSGEKIDWYIRRVPVEEKLELRR